MQKAYVSALYDLISRDKRVISCLSDSGTEYDELIMREFGSQVINFGISENNKLAVAAGLAAAGKIPFVYTTGAFIVYRSYEFLRDDICLQNRNVKLVGMGTGMTWSTLGPTHHTTEDIALLRVLPNLTILTPASPRELEEMVKAAYAIDGPVYIRMGMAGEKEIYGDDDCYNGGKNRIVREGKDITVFVTGSIVSEVLEAADFLKREGIDTKVIHVGCLKPLDIEGILQVCQEKNTIISVEEHNVIGGLGTALADVIAEHQLSVRLVKLGLEDCFAVGFGTHAQVLQQNHLDSASIYQKIQQAIECSTRRIHHGDI